MFGAKTPECSKAATFLSGHLSILQVPLPHSTYPWRQPTTLHYCWILPRWSDTAEPMLAKPHLHLSMGQHSCCTPIWKEESNPIPFLPYLVSNCHAAEWPQQRPVFEFSPSPLSIISIFWLQSCMDGSRALHIHYKPSTAHRQDALGVKEGKYNYCSVRFNLYRMPIYSLQTSV